MLEAERFAGIAEGEAFVTRAVVGHAPHHGDAQRLVGDDGGMEEGNGAFPLLVRQDLAECDARGIVDDDGEVLSATAQFG